MPADPTTTPANNVTAMKSTPTSALAPAIRSQTNDVVRLESIIAEHKPVTTKAMIGDPHGADVDVEDAHAFALDDIGGREEQAEGDQCGHCRDGCQAEDSGERRRRRTVDSAAACTGGEDTAFVMGYSHVNPDSSFFDQRPECQRTPDAEQDCKDGQQSNPRPPFGDPRTSDTESGFRRSCSTYQHR